MSVSTPTITAVDALTVLDSRGRPTLRAFVEIDNRNTYVATAPAGASTGTLESKELRDGGKPFGGLGVEKAIAGVRTEIATALRGASALDQNAVDRTLVELDGTNERSRLGANAIVAVSMAVARAGAGETHTPLWRYLSNTSASNDPIPQFNVLNGGVHARGGLRLQEFMLIPSGVSGTAARVRCGAEIYAALRALLVERNASTGLGDEGGFVFGLGDVTDALELLMEAIGSAGYTVGREVFIGIDAAANAFRDGSVYSPEAGLSLTAAQMTTWWGHLLGRFPISVLEDPLADDDWDGWRGLTSELRDRVTIVGDDIFVTHEDIIARAIRERVANAVLLKPNQIGTVSETVAAAHTAKAGRYAIVVSHRSGETGDTFIADLAVAIGADYLKSGSPARGERTEKYNRLLEIDRERGLRGAR